MKAAQKINEHLPLKQILEIVYNAQLITIYILPPQIFMNTV